MRGRMEQVEVSFLGVYTSKCRRTQDMKGRMLSTIASVFVQNKGKVCMCTYFHTYALICVSRKECREKMATLNLPNPTDQSSFSQGMGKSVMSLYSVSYFRPVLVARSGGTRLYLDRLI